uniref:3-hydroxyacyl-CoA dehydrogenase C-terminal domain-containing protein n=1 Tax=Parascaris equorum TaxID=6256 RepID=A0A914S5T3_PAREQ
MSLAASERASISTFWLNKALLFPHLYLKNFHPMFTGWHKAYPNEALFQPSEILNQLVAAGKRGKKSGEGFYRY